MDDKKYLDKIDSSENYSKLLGKNFNLLKNSSDIKKLNFLDKYFDEEEFIKLYSKSVDKDYKIPHDIEEYNKALALLNCHGCKILDKKDLYNIEEIFEALDVLVEDETTSEILKNLKTILKK